ncbi:IclR family transcriptional regulator domain-containing protein [Streptomyces exfoliatus]|uniref:IclR family transcriptional regulator domain-containing protein n=1 Tax=Streptomyces exfoliatus TaxID=1905 RepID=UPI0007C514D6|nr:IclR family transcriptional regulator C-terminal domain-containing protein [Streptomyces exfoliatus]
MSGERLPGHATAYGKVLLTAPPAELPRLTRHTVASPGPLAAQLARIRAEGLAVCAEEHRLGEITVAAPVRGPAGPVAALGVTVTAGVPLERVTAAVREAARACLLDQAGSGSGAWCVRSQGGGGSQRGALATDDNAASVRARPREPGMIRKTGPRRVRPPAP